MGNSTIKPDLGREEKLRERNRTEELKAGVKARALGLVSGDRDAGPRGGGKQWREV